MISWLTLINFRLITRPKHGDMRLARGFLDPNFFLLVLRLGFGNILTNWWERVELLLLLPFIKYFLLEWGLLWSRLEG